MKSAGAICLPFPCLLFTPQATSALLQQHLFKKGNAFWGLLLKMQQQPAFEVLHFNNHYSHRSHT